MFAIHILLRDNLVNIFCKKRTTKKWLNQIWKITLGLFFVSALDYIRLLSLDYFRQISNIYLSQFKFQKCIYTSSATENRLIIYTNKISTDAPDHKIIGYPNRNITSDVTSSIRSDIREGISSSRYPIFFGYIYTVRFTPKL